MNYFTKLRYFFYFGKGFRVKIPVTSKNIFAIIKNNSVKSENISEFIKNISVRTVRNDILDGPKVSFGRFKIFFGPSETREMCVITKKFIIITKIFTQITNGFTLYVKEFIGIFETNTKKNGIYI